MGKMSRTKGAQAERELAGMLRSELGDVTRNLNQTRDGGCDLLGVGPFALEVKRQEKLELRAWWQQACDQADRERLIPALAYRQSYRPWQFVVPAGALMHSIPMDGPVAYLEIDGFVTVTRELISMEGAA